MKENIHVTCEIDQKVFFHTSFKHVALTPTAWEISWNLAVWKLFYSPTICFEAGPSGMLQH